MLRSRVLAVVFLLSAFLSAQSPNPIPFVNQPLVPTAVEPGAPGLTLTVNGTGFAPTSVVKWNGFALATTFVNSSKLFANVPASSVAAPGTASVTVFTPSPGGGTSNPVPFMVTTAASSVNFFASTIPAGLGAAAIVVADFNNDGKADLAVMNEEQPDSNCYQYQGAGTISIFLGNGGVTFSPAPPVCLPDYRGTLGLPGLTVTDLNGDGKMDLIAEWGAFASGGGYATYLGNGNGSFSPSSYDTWDGAIGPNIVAADFDRDGKMDIAFGAQIMVSQPGIWAFLGNGGYSYFMWYGGWDLAVGDFNNDGLLDLLMATDGIAIGQGNGTFTPSSLNFSPYGPVAVADFDGDGNLDFVCADSRSNTLWLFRGHGDGTFTQVTGEPALQNPTTDVAIADFNSDGKLDLVFSETNTIEVLLGNGDGTFQPGFTVPVGNAPQSVAVGDFNGDGRMDIAVVNSADNTVSILLQPTSTLCVLDSSLNPSWYGETFKLKATVVPAGKGIPTGNVTFYDGASPLATVPISHRRAILALSALAAGEHSITASYSGDGVFGSSTSAPVVQLVKRPAVRVTLSSSLNPSSVNQAVTFSAAVSGRPTTPTGSVTFKQGKSFLATVPLTNGQASLTTAFAKAGTFSIDANYSGDQNYLPENSAPVRQVVNK